MDVNYREIGKFFSRRNLWDKPFREWSKREMGDLVDVILSCVDDPSDGWKPPFLNDKDELIIPFRCPLKYKYWNEGSLTLEQILEEIGASETIKSRYRRLPFDDRF